MLELREQGFSHSAIASVLGISITTVSVDLSAVGGDPRPIRPSLVGTRRRRQLAHELRRLGMTQEAIAKELGVTQQAVSGYLAEPAPPRLGTTPRTARIGVATLARRIRQSEAFTREMLDAWRAAGWADERNGKWAFTGSGFRTFGGVRALEGEPQPTEAARPERPTKVARPKKPESSEADLGWCSCGCGARVAYGRNQLRAYAPGHEPAAGKPTVKQLIARERQAAADAKPTTSRCARCGASFGPGPLSVVRAQFKSHACETAA